MFVADKDTTPGQIAAFNAASESNLTLIAQYIRPDNGATPKDTNDLLSLCGIPSGSVTVTIGTVDDGSSGGGTAGVAPTVTGYGYSAASPTPGG